MPHTHRTQRTHGAMHETLKKYGVVIERQFYQHRWQRLNATTTKAKRH